MPSVAGSANITVIDPGGGGGCSTTGSANWTSELTLLAILWLHAFAGRWRGPRRLRRFASLLLALAILFFGGTAFGQVVPDIGGPWAKTDGGTRSEYLKGVKRSWHVRNVQVSGNTVKGELALVGASFLRVGRFEATVVRERNGARLAGTVTDERGNEVATLTGGVTEKGLRGQITATNGEVVDWAWDTPEPERLRGFLDLLSSR
jgi:hypothetical protein